MESSEKYTYNFPHAAVAVDCVIFAFDNEPRNIQLHNMMEKAIDNGHSIVVWPNIPEKDINEMVLAYGYDRTKEMLDINTYSGNTARLKFLTWRKI